MTYGATTTPPRLWSPDEPWLTWWERAEREADTRRADMAAEVAALVAGRGAGEVGPFTPDREIRRVADLRADLMRRELETIETATDAGALADWINARVTDLGARPFRWPGCDKGKPPPAGAVGPMMARASCPAWWRRQLRRVVVRARELEGMQAGEIRARRQLYCTDDTLARRIERQRANRAMLEATEIEDAAGQVITLAQAADASTSNKAIRRGELMTRIKGCEVWAEAAGMVGIFTTNTCPSRFHPQLMSGGANPNHQGATPRDGQRWLRDTWAKCRAKLARLRVACFGFRVAEPHHDGCPHWHLLVWCRPADLQTLRDTMRAAWLADAGDEPGAAAHRFKAKTMEAGGAAGYIAKYIAKNIDDAGAVATEGHHDTDHQGQTDMVGTGKAQRVEAWATAHGIRQFQALGQPPVTVWRELRRIDGAMVAGMHRSVREAHAAVQREGDRLASWAGYMRAQGGAMVGRAYGVRIAYSEGEQAPGRYGDPVAPRPVGVCHVSRPGEWALSTRRQWKPAGTWARAAAVPVAQAQPGAFIIGEGGRFEPNPQFEAWQAGRPWVDGKGRAHRPAGAEGEPDKPGRLPWVVDLGEGLQAPCPPRTRVSNCTGGPLAAWQIERFARQHGRLSVALADLQTPLNGTGGWRNFERASP